MPNLLQTLPSSMLIAERPPTEGASDEALAARAPSDAGAFALLYERYLDRVYRYCFRRLGSREAAEDATSLVFMKALAALPRFRGGAFRAWLFTIAHHVVVDRYRRAWSEQSLETAGDLLDVAPSPEDLALAADEWRIARGLLSHLPEHQRQVVELRLAGLTGAEIGEVLGRSAANVNVTQYRALARLRALAGVPDVPEERRDEG